MVIVLGDEVRRPRLLELQEGRLVVLGDEVRPPLQEGRCLGRLRLREGGACSLADVARRPAAAASAARVRATPGERVDTRGERGRRRVDAAPGAATIGDPMSTDTHVGPVTTPPQYQKILDYIAIAKSEGAICVLGGGPYQGAGAKGQQFVQPTIFTGVSNDMRIAQEEVFGPVLSIIPFDSEDDAIQIGNDIVYGLAAGVWTSDIGRALRMSERLKAGTVWVNTYRAVSFTSPFGGYKRSGEGRESGKDAIKEFLQVKSVWIAQQTTAANPFVMR